jgi:hypothetical protein
MGHERALTALGIGREKSIDDWAKASSVVNQQVDDLF